jgi:primary-amine oxidase
LNIRPADFFTSNPALDVPGKKNETSVLVPCCANEDTASSSGLKTDETGESDREDSVQIDPVTHLQGNGPELDPKRVGAKTTGKERKLSRALYNLLKRGGGWPAKNSS